MANVLKFDIISLDMFQTLVDGEAVVPLIWKKILKGNYTEQRKHLCEALIKKGIDENIHNPDGANAIFMNVKEILTPCFLAVSREINVYFNPEEAMRIFVEEKGRSPSYPDSDYFLKTINTSIRACLASDADNDMIQPLLERFQLDRIFTSENVKSYKNGYGSKMFDAIIAYYGVEPKRILHIGDGTSDVLGSKLSGITACWINRENRLWYGGIKPDYMVNTLSEVFDIIK